MTKDEIIFNMKKSANDAAVLTQRSSGYHSLFAAEVQAGNLAKAEEMRGLLHALLDQTLDATARSSQLVRALYTADD